MNGFDRIHDVHRILKGRRAAVSLQDLLRELECSKATFFRIKRHMTDFLGAPIEYRRELGGYLYAEGAGDGYELPGVWFNEQELHALLLIQSLASNFGVLKDVLAPIEARFNELLGKSSISADQIKNKVKFLGVATRSVDNAIFVPAVTAVLQSQRVSIRYRKRECGEESQRELSPQHIINYRNNWYMDAWCHSRKALRTFALECIQEFTVLSEPYKSFKQVELDRYYQASYGVYAGGKVKQATIRFAKEIAQRIADENWHPEQKGKLLKSGEYELELPYNADAPEELIRDVLALGRYASVLKPAALRKQIKAELSEVQKLYDVGA